MYLLYVDNLIHSYICTLLLILQNVIVSFIKYIVPLRFAIMHYLFSTFYRYKLLDIYHLSSSFQLFYEIVSNTLFLFSFAVLASPTNLQLSYEPFAKLFEKRPWQTHDPRLHFLFIVNPFNAYYAKLLKMCAVTTYDIGNIQDGTSSRVYQSIYQPAQVETTRILFIVIAI